MTAPPLLEGVGLRKSYPARGGGLTAAVDGVDLELAAGEALGVVGASGVGKSTLARLLLALERPDAGVVRFDGVVVSDRPETAVRTLRRRFQPVFQDPLASFDPHMSIEASVREPLDAMEIGDRDDRRRRVARLLEQVGLDPDLGRRRPASVSGGERQRAAIARALAPEPELLVLDEPLSSLDPPVAVQILDLLDDLRQRLGLAVVLVSHDLGVVGALCERVAVMLAGKIVERGETAQVLDDPAHPYTRQLIEAAPALEL